MKILVTGGTVFASRFTAEYFIKKGHEVYVLNRGTKSQPEGARHIKCDRHNIGDRMKGMKFDLIADVTAYTEEDVKDLVTALSDPDGGYSFDNYVFISSSAVYPETLPQPFREEQRCGENKHWGDYGLNKLAAERYLRENVPNAYILRPPYLYGQMNNLYREAFVFECAEKGLPFYVPGNGEMPLQFFHIEDLCGFIEIITEKRPEQKIYNVGNSETVTVNDWVRLCYNVVGKTPEIVSVSGHDPRSYFCFRDYGYMLNTSRQHELMPNEKPLETGLAEAYEWYRENRDKVRKKDYLEYIDANLKEYRK